MQRAIIIGANMLTHIYVLAAIGWHVESSDIVGDTENSGLHSS
jgi:hypothetical protein